MAFVGAEATDKYANYMLEKARNSGASAEEIAKQIENLKNFKVMYQNPLWNFLFTFIEPLPVGLIVTVVSAIILRRKRKGLDGEQQLATS